MKEITYLIPTKYLNSEIPATKPIAVKAWKTPAKGLIVQRPIAPSRRGEVHLTHKASGAILVFNVKGLKTAVAIARALKRLPIDFSVYNPATLYRQFAKLTDRQVQKFRKAAGQKGDVAPGAWQTYALHCARHFDEVAARWTGTRAKRSGQARRNRKGKAWKAKNRK